jgi:hypothetical protein
VTGEDQAFGANAAEKSHLDDRCRTGSSCGERRHSRRNPNWVEIQREWMQPLGWSYYGRKLRERLGGPPAIL